MDVFDLVATIALDTSEYEGGLKGAKEKTEGFAGKLKSGLKTAAKVGAAAIGAASAAVTAFAKASVDTGMAFDSSMSQVAATMGTTVDQIGELREFALEMGANTAFSASQAADALNYMALAGYDASESMQALPNVLNLAAAGGIELAAASDMVTDAQSALGLSMEGSAELVDQMAMASSKSNTSVAQLGEAILTIGGTARNLAGGTTELSTALGILADNGVKGAEGGTALRNIILSLSAPTDTAAAAMKSLGLEVYDADGNLRPLNDTFGDLNEALSTMTQGEQTQALNQIFNKVDLKSVNALLANSGERFDELSGYISEAQGAAEAMADTQLDNLAGGVTLFKSALEGAQIVLSDRLSPKLREFVQFGSNAVTALSTAFQEGGLSGAMDALGTVLSDGLNMVFQSLPEVIEAGMSLLSALGQGIMSNLPTLLGAAAEVVLTLADGIAESLPALVPSIVDMVIQIVDTLIENVDMLVDASIAIVLALADGLIDALPKLIEKAPEIIQKLIAALQRNFPKIVRAGGELLGKLVVGLMEAIPSLAASLPKIVDTIEEGLRAGWEAVKNAGKYLLEGLWAGISDKVAWLKDKVGGVVDTIKGWFTGKDGFDEHSPSKWAATVGEYMMQGLSIGMENSKGEVIKTAAGIVDEVKNRFSSLADALTARQDVGSLQYELWERTDGRNATEAEKYEKQLELLTNQQRDQKSIVDAAAAAYETVVEQYGESSRESYEYQKTLLEEQLAYQDLLDSINEVIAARRALYGSGVSRVSYSDSSLARTSAAAVNAITSSTGNQKISVTSNLLLENGQKVASWLLPDLTNVAKANGTPIVNPI